MLGKPGLIHAYGESARLALDAANIVERVVMERAVFECGYDRFDGMKSDVLVHGGRITESVFAARCTATIEVPKGTLEELLPKWTLLGISAKPQ